MYCKQVHVLFICPGIKHFLPFSIGPGTPDPTEDPLPPLRPIHLVCTVDSPTSILLTWQTPLSSGSTTHYTVTYFLRSRIKHVPVKRTVYSENIVLRGLTPGREYTISVQSHYKSEKEIFPGVSTAFKNCKLPLSGMKNCFITKWYSFSLPKKTSSWGQNFVFWAFALLFYFRTKLTSTKYQI